MEFTTKLIEDGDDLAIIIPPEVMKFMGVDVGSEIQFSVKDGKIYIKPVNRQAPHSEDVLESPQID